MKLNYRRTFFIGLAFMSICSFWQLYENIVPLILQKTFSCGDTEIGIIMALDNIVALFLLPFFGMLSDKTDTRLGKRTPFILTGTIISAVVMMIMPIADQNKSKFLFIAALCIVLLSMGTYRSPAVALMPDVTPAPLRSQANAVINLMGAAGSALSLVLIMFLVTKDTTVKPDYIPVFATVAAFMILAVIILLITVHEKKLVSQMQAAQTEEAAKIQSNAKMQSQTETMEHKGSKAQEVTESVQLEKPVKKSLILLLCSVFLWFAAYNAVTTAFSRYVVNVWDMGNTGFTGFLMVAMGAAIVSYIPIGYLSSKFGRKKTILSGIILITVSYICGCFFTSYSPLIYPVFVLTGFGWAAINVNSYPMVVEMSKGSNIGKYTGYYYSFSMTAQVLTPILSGILLEHISYRTLFPYAVVFSLASLATMIFVKHGDAKPEKKKNALENFDTAD